MSQPSIAYVDIRAFAHATEDLDKVVDAVKHVLPSDHVDEIVLRRSNLRGHHGNPITLLEARLKEKEIIKAFVENLSSRLDTSDKESLGREIHSHLEEGSLYVRLDKQAAFQDQLKLAIADPIHVRLRFRKMKIDDLVKMCQKLGMLV